MKKRIAIFNDFQRPIPPVNGGSVPNLINMLLLENEEQQKFDEKLKRNPNYRFVYASKWN